MPTLNKHSKVKVSVSVQPDGDEYTIGDPITGRFIRVPAEAIQIIDLLDGERSIIDIYAFLKEEKELDLDVLDFVKTLNKVGLVERIDDQNINVIDYSGKQNEKIVLAGKMLFNPYTNYIYIACFLGSVVIMLSQKDLFPVYRDIFIFDYVGLSILLFFIISWVMTFFHELAHYLAAYKEGIHTRFRLSLRLFWLVAEADMTGLWSAPTKKRYLPYLAGMAWDSLFLFIGLMIQIVNISPFINRLGALLSLILLFRMAWQFLIFLRTDIYYVLANRLSTTNLHHSANTAILYRFNKSKKIEWSTFNEREKRYAKRLGILYLFGYLMACILFLGYQLPGALVACFRSITQIIESSLLTFNFYDGLITLLVISVDIILWGIGALTKYKRRGKDIYAQADTPGTS